jgi:hypothetical protein
MPFLQEFIKLRTEQSKELTHLELDRNLQYVSNPWSPSRKYLEGMIVYYTDSTTSSTGGIDDLTWYRANKNNGPSNVFDFSDWDPIGASAQTGQIVVKDSGGIFDTVGVIELGPEFTVTFLGSTALLNVTPGAFDVWQQNIVDPDTIYYTDNVLIGTSTIINPSYILSVAGNAIVTGNLDVNGLVDGVDISVLNSSYLAHTHTIVGTSLPGYTASYPNSKGQLADVLLTGLTDGDFLRWNASLKRWVNTVSTVSPHTLGSHTDVNSSVSISPINNQIFIYNGTSSLWENRTLTLNNNTGFTGAPFAHNHDGRYWTQSALAANTGSIINWNNIFGAPTFTPANAQYVVLSLTGNLSEERVLTAGTGISIVDSGANAPVTLSVIDNTGIQKIEVYEDNSLVGTRKAINFISPVSNNIIYTITDNIVDDRIDIQFDLSSIVTLTLDGLSDVDVPFPSDGQVLTFDLATNTWIATTPIAAPVLSVNGFTGNVLIGISELEDTVINPGNFPGPGTGAPFTPSSNILVYDDDIAKWTNIPASALLAGISSIYLDDILDVEINTSLTDLDLLYYDASLGLWVNGSANDAGLYTQIQLNTSGGGGQVHWDNLIDIPPLAPASHSHYVYELIDVQDYSATPPNDGDILEWDAALQLWVVAPSGGGGSTVDTADPIYGDGSVGDPVNLSYHTGDFTLTTSNISGGTQGIMLNLDFTTLPTPVMAGNWTVRKNDNLTLFPATVFQNGTTVQGSMTGTSIRVPVGSYVNLTSGTATIPALGPGQQGPTTVTGNFTFVPNPPVAFPSISNVLSQTNIISNSTFTVNMSKPKSGLEVSAGRVVRATGNDTASGSIAVTFSNVFYYGYIVVGPPLTPINQVQVDSITASQIEAFTNLRFGDNRSQSFVVNDSAPSGTRVVFAYPASFGNVATLIKTGSTTNEITAFTRCSSPINITTVSGAVIPYIFYVANAANAWNTTLTIS